MTRLDLMDRDLLAFLCICADKRVRVVAIKAPSRASLRRLRNAGLVGWDDYLPSASGRDWWREREAKKNGSKIPADTCGPEDPPAPKVGTEGGGAARCDAPPPNDDQTIELPDEPVADAAGVSPFTQPPDVSEVAIDLDRLLTCFGDEFEALSVLAGRYGCSVPRIVTISRRLRHNHLVEWQPPISGRMFSLWRRAQQNNRGAVQVANGEGLEPRLRPVHPGEPRHARKQPTPDAAASTQYPGASGPPREGPSAEESTSAKRIKDRAPINEPASSVAPEARAHPVDIKVNIGPRRDPTEAPELPQTELRDRQVANGFRRAAAVRRGQEQEAAARLDAGLIGRSSVEKNLMVMVARRREDEARLTDPVERAKTFIRSRGYSCFAAYVSIGEEGRGKFYVGRKLVDEAELLAIAKRLAA